MIEWSHCNVNQLIFVFFYCFLRNLLPLRRFYALSNSLFTFLHENPICRPSTVHLNAINNWVEQLKYIDKSYTDHRKLMLRGQLQNLFCDNRINTISLFLI